MKLREQLFEHYLDIRRPERDRVLLMSTYLLLIITAYSITKAVRDSLFVARIGPAQLPYVYLLIAGAMGLVSFLHSKAVRRISLYQLIRITSLFSIFSFLLFWVVSGYDSAAWFYVLYVWASVFGAITASQFWLLATHVFNPREARRLFAWIGVGGILGGALGGSLTHRLANSLGTESLLIVCAALMVATLILLQRISRVSQGGADSATSTQEQTDDADSAVLAQLRQSRHLTVMVLLLAVAVVVEAVIDYEYKFVARQSIASKDQLTAFFGAITFYTGIFSLLFQLLVAHRILKRFGVGWAILLLPVGLLAAFLTLAVYPGLWAAALLQLVDGGFSYSIHRSGMELLYLPIAPKTRNAVKGFIDLFVDRMGRAVGAILLLLCTAVLAFSVSAVSLVGGGLAIAWIAMSVVVKREYLDSFRKALERKTIEPEALDLHEVDKATMRTLVGLLSGDDERQVLYALDLLSNIDPDRWRVDLRRLAHHPSSAVRARTIAILAEWNHRLLVREEFVRHPDYETARVAMACALRLKWTDSYSDRRVLNRLLYDSSVAVAREAMTTAGSVGFKEAVPLLITKLSDKNLRSHARQALLAFDSVIPELVRRMSDPAEKPWIRRRIPETLALTGKQEAADALMQHLDRVDFHLNHSILKALNKVRITSPSVVFDYRIVTAALSSERERYDRLNGAYIWLRANPLEDEVFPLLMRALVERFERRRERMFRLLALVHSPNDLYSAYYNYQMKPALRPAAIEFLDNILDADLKNTVIPVLEESSEADPELHLQQAVQFASLDEALSVVASVEDPWLQTLAAADFTQPWRSNGALRRRMRATGEIYTVMKDSSMSKQTAELSPIDKVLCLQSVDIFKHATTEMLAYIGSIAHEVTAPRDQVIFAEDEISDAMYVVITGRVRLDKTGKEILTVTAGQSFGGWALLDNQPRPMSATAMEDVHLLKIRSDDFYELLSDQSDITPAIFRAVIERVSRLIAD